MFFYTILTSRAVSGAKLAQSVVLGFAAILIAHAARVVVHAILVIFIVVGFLIAPREGYVVSQLAVGVLPHSLLLRVSDAHPVILEISQCAKEI